MRAWFCHLWIPLGVSMLFVAPAAARTRRPDLILDRPVHRGEVELILSVVDVSGVRLYPDDPHPLKGFEFSFYMARGPLDREPDRMGRLESREVYRGPVTLVVFAPDGRELERLEFEEPNSPPSTPRRSVYRARRNVTMVPGTRVRLEPVPGWVSEPVIWEVPSAYSGRPGWRTGWFFFTGTLLFLGLHLLALAIGGDDGRQSAGHESQSRRARAR